jgi:hypothetical protein
LADFLKKPPPPGPTTIIIPPAAHINGQRVTPLPYPHAHGRVKNFLKDMLREKLRLFPKGLIEPALKDLSPVQIVDDLRHQLDAYWRNEWPFNQPVKDNDPLAWWKALEDHPYARVLAVRTT